MIYMPGDGSATEYPGGYSDMEVKLSGRSEKSSKVKENKGNTTKDKAPEKTQETRKTGRLSYNQQRLLEVLPEQIKQLEKEIAELIETLSNPDLYTRDPEKFDQASQELADKRQLVEDCENKWLEIQLLKEDLEK